MPSATPRTFRADIVDTESLSSTYELSTGRADPLPVGTVCLVANNPVNSRIEPTFFATNPHLRKIMKNTLYAIHRDGARLYPPRWDADGEIIASKLPTAAVTITSDGVTFPDGSTWIRKPRGCGLLDGWTLASNGKATHDSKPRKKRAPNTSLLLRYAASAHSAHPI